MLSDEQLAEIRDLRKDSQTLNAIGFAAAIALGMVPEGVEEILGDPIEQIRQLLDVTNPSWVSRDNLERALAHLAHAVAVIAEEANDAQ